MNRVVVSLQYYTIRNIAQLILFYFIPLLKIMLLRHVEKGKLMFNLITNIVVPKQFIHYIYITQQEIFIYDSDNTCNDDNVSNW